MLLIWPKAEVGVNDDWVYTITALDFLRTGHFIFHGWASPMLGWQAMWGALFAKLFGATFTAVRLSTVPVAAANVLLYHAILRRFGLNPAHATFGTLVLALSPVFLPLSASFMTDVPAVFAILVCLYLCQLSLAASSNSRTILWLTAAALSNVALGTVRQIAWLGVLVIVPSCVWLLRRRRHVLWVGPALWFIGVICIYLMTSWFAHQPYTAPEKLIPDKLTLHLVRFMAGQVLRAGMTTLLLLLPILTIGLASAWRYRRRMIITTAPVLLALALLLALFHRGGQAHVIESPWLGNTFGLRGILQDGLFQTNTPAPVPWRLLLFFAVVISAVASLAAFTAYRQRFVTSDTTARQTASWRDVSILLLPYLVCYCALLLPRATFFVLFDRYLLEIVAVLAVYALRWHQEHIRNQIPALSKAVLALIAVLTVAGTHDLFSAYRAEIRLANELQSAGIPRTEIRGGFAYDFATQVSSWGYVNDKRTLNPPGAYHPQPEIEPYKRDGVYCDYPILRYLPALHIRYVISAELTPCLAPSSFAPQSYRTWLPPARRQLIVGKLLPPPAPTR
jgi:hypothetical protein